jgi:acylphosphatase
VNDDEKTRRALHLTITGRVHGVGYRDFVQREASERELAGWVRNRRDGSVEAVVVGPEAAVDSLIDACRRGPSAAAVADIRVTDYTGPFLAGFMVLPTE